MLISRGAVRIRVLGTYIARAYFPSCQANEWGGWRVRKWRVAGGRRRGHEVRGGRQTRTRVRGKAWRKYRAQDTCPPAINRAPLMQCTHLPILAHLVLLPASTACSFLEAQVQRKAPQPKPSSCTRDAQTLFFLAYSFRGVRNRRTAAQAYTAHHPS
ncbi:hypothetical protein C8F04DRAFT_1130518 [Mycena alexandri]|uniref:Uncharacterized protein n=1 Tax=Mycena alexandri TaxID=1745969 RepID=A0AAD6SBF9_9AGAR|nr:hypothetical protein C8F04DRAFT_1130518 [Mycena alexandri]